MSVTADRLREVLHYDPLTGGFTRRANGAATGSVSRKIGCIEISVDGKSYWAQRLAWLHINGNWPIGKLRFLDGVKTNVAIANLVDMASRVNFRALPAAEAQARAKQLLHYDLESGIFTRRIDWFEHRAGDVAGTLCDGYVTLGIDGDAIQAQRLAVLYVTGEWPRGVVDHRDGDGSNNRWTNLRDVTQQVNMQNQRHARSNSGTGLLGAFVGKDGRFESKIKNAAGSIVRLGDFDTAQEAHETYLAAKRQLHEGCTL